MATHGSLTKAGKVRGQTPKEKEERSLEQTQNYEIKVILEKDSC